LELRKIVLQRARGPHHAVDWGRAIHEPKALSLQTDI
jgi:hypothetical protein